MENELNSKWDGYVDWRGKAASKTRHGGFRATFFVLGNNINLFGSSLVNKGDRISMTNEQPKKRAIELPIDICVLYIKR